MTFDGSMKQPEGGLNPEPQATRFDITRIDFSKDSSLSKTDLDNIIQESSQSGDDETSSVATFLKDNFNDFRSISAKGGDEIGSDDLTLYSEMMKQNEKNIADGNHPDAGLYAVHNNYENREGFLLPAIGTLGGIYGADKLLGLVARNPVSLIATFKGGAPGVAILGLTHVAGWVGGGIIGANLGGMIDRSLQNGTVQAHFVDEAAPAMKRLLEKQNPMG